MMCNIVGPKHIPIGPAQIRTFNAVFQLNWTLVEYLHCIIMEYFIEMLTYIIYPFYLFIAKKYELYVAH